MATLTIVKDLDPFEDQVSCVSAGSLRLVKIKFQLEGGKKALHRRVVPAFPLSAHTLERLEALQSLSVFDAGVLDSRLGQSGTRMGPAR